MLILDINIFEISKYITHPISLIAFVCALITYFFIQRNINDRKKLQANPTAYQATAERLNLDIKKVPVADRTRVTLEVLRTRIYLQIIIALALLTGGLIIAYIVVDYNRTNNFTLQEIERVHKDNERRQREIDDSIAKKRYDDSILIVNQQDSLETANKRQTNKIQLMIDKGKALIDSIYAGKQRAWTSAYYFFGKDMFSIVAEIEKDRTHKEYNIRLIQYEEENQIPHYDDPGSQRITDSTYALRAYREYIDILENLKASL